MACGYAERPITAHSAQLRWEAGRLRTHVSPTATTLLLRPNSVTNARNALPPFRPGRVWAITTSVGRTLSSASRTRASYASTPAPVESTVEPPDMQLTHMALPSPNPQLPPEAVVPLGESTRDTTQTQSTPKDRDPSDTLLCDPAKDGSDTEAAEAAHEEAPSNTRDQDPTSTPMGATSIDQTEAGSVTVGAEAADEESHWTSSRPTLPPHGPLGRLTRTSTWPECQRQARYPWLPSPTTRWRPTCDAARVRHPGTTAWLTNTGGRSIPRPPSLRRHSTSAYVIAACQTPGGSRGQSSSTRGDWQDPANWRAISLGCTVAKLYAGSFAARLQQWLSDHRVLSRCQKGLIPHDGVFEQNFVLQERLNVARTGGGDLCVAFLDYANAFESVVHNALVDAVRGSGAREAFASIVKDLYSGNTTSIVDEVGITEPIKISSGIRQGCPLN
ncbi:uncharacterized protein ISCGN_013784 [Ixodes scapularis]